MKNKILLSLLLLFTISFSYGQILTFDFDGLSGNEATANSNSNDLNLSSSVISRGSGLTASNNGNRFNATSWATTNIANAVSGNDYMEFTITPNATYDFTVSTIVVNFQRSGTGTRGLALRNSLDSYASNIDGEKSITDNTSVQSFTFTVSQSSSSSAVTYRVYGWAESTGGSGGFEGTGNDIVVNGTVSSGTPCATPTAQPTSLDLTSNITSTSIDGTFTASSPAADNYLVVVSTSATLSGNPVDTTTYTAGDSLGGGTVAYSGSSTSFTASGLSSGTLYYFFVFSYNDTGCTGGPLYYTTSPLSDSETTTSSACTDLFISEYVEGSSNNKYIEIYNPTGSSINLSSYSLRIYSNGSATVSTTIALSGTILSDDVWVVGNPSGTLYTEDQSSGSLSFNGDDAVALYDGTSNIDVIGQIGLDPGSEWTGTTCTQGTANGTLVRNFGIDEGDSDGSNAFDPDTEWTCYASDDVSNLGSHSSTCGACTPTHTISSFTPTSGPVGTLVTITGTGFSASSTVAFDGTAAVTVTFNNSTEIVATVPVGATTGAITVTESGCDLDSATDYTVTVCTPTHTVSSFAPTSGPVGTIVTITGTGFSGSSTVDFNGTSATIISQTTTELVVEVPSGASTGLIRVTEGGCALDSTTFTFIDDADCSLGAPVGWSDLLISGIYDDSSDSCHYIELYNPTGSSIDLSTYGLGNENNNASATSPPGGVYDASLALSGTIAANDTFMILVTTQSSGSCTNCSSLDLDLEFYDVSSFGYNGYTTGSGGYDKIVLIEDFGTTDTEIDMWANGEQYNVGYIYTRDTGSTAPIMSYDNADWTSSTTEDCFGFAISSTPAPTVTVQPADTSSCSGMTMSITATPGNSGTLTYQWKYNDGSASGWTDVITSSFAPGTTTGETSNTLTITGFDLDGYQFYCEVTEDATCSIGSNAAQVSGVTTATWSSGAWSMGILPTSSRAVILDDDYTTSSSSIGSFECCSLTVNSGVTLDIDGTNHYVGIETDLTVDGTIQVRDDASIVMVDDSGSVTNNGTINVYKTSSAYEQYDYIYWSSPITNADLGTVLASSVQNRIYYYNAANFFDGDADNYDDNFDDWTPTSGVMSPGRGYIAMASASSGGSQSVVFSGTINNGVITEDVYTNASDPVDTGYNLVGNPYPSSLYADEFISQNSNVDGTIYLWTHIDDISASNPGPNAYNFSTDDYASYNLSGGVGTGSGSPSTSGSNPPTGEIASGQSFFVLVDDSLSTVTFNNSMRDVTYNNNQFFRSNISAIEKDRVWLNLTNTDGMFSQTLVGFFENATEGVDKHYDGLSITTGTYINFYSMLNGNEYKIQGKDIFENSDVVDLGYVTNVLGELTISIDNVEGILADVPVYLEDSLLNVVHDLSASDYTFEVTEVGTFNDRFKLQFQSSLSVDEVLNHERNLTVFNNEDNIILTFNSQQETMESIKAYDLLGKLIFDERVTDNRIELPSFKLKKGTVLLFKVQLSDGNILIKKFIKN